MSNGSTPDEERESTLGNVNHVAISVTKEKWDYLRGKLDAADVAYPLGVTYMPSWAYGQLLLLLHSLPAMHNLLDAAEKVGWGKSLELLCSVALTCEQRVMLLGQMQRSFDFLSQVEAWVPVDDAS